MSFTLHEQNLHRHSRLLQPPQSFNIFNISNIKLFESKQIHSQWDAEAEKWYFSVQDVVEVLTDTVNDIST